MKRILGVLLILIVQMSYSQDYLVDERFYPEDFEPEEKIEMENHRSINSWALNSSMLDEEELINTWGSNYFAFKYQYDQPLFLGVHWNLGFGYNWDNYKLKQRSDMMLHDSIFHDKSKLRIQNVSFHTGIRFQTSKNSKKALFLQVNGYANVTTYTKLITWDEVGDMELKNQTKNLDYITPYHYGVESRVGYGMFSFFARYRLSDVFEASSNYRELPRFALGIELETWE